MALFKEMKKRAKIIVVAVFLVGITIGSYFLMPPAADAWAAADDLAKTEAFGFGPQGATAQISDDETRFFRILQSPKSHLVFRHLYDTGTPAAKAYAFVGLKQSLIGRADTRIDNFASLTTSFQTLSGCSGGDATPKKFVSAWDQDSFLHYVRIFR